LELLGATANHTYAANDIIRALAPRHSRKALEVALALNVAPRKDEALSRLLESMLSVQDDQLDLSAFDDIMTSYYDRERSKRYAIHWSDYLS
jgi:thioredoxin-like negative regulator of GroEL